MKVPAKRKELWHPTQSDVAVAQAIQNMATGTASEAQQKAVLDWLITTACQTYEEAFVPDNPRVTDYVLGRRSVGLAIVKHLHLNTAAFKKLEKS